MCLWSATAPLVASLAPPGPPPKTSFRTAGLTLLCSIRSLTLQPLAQASAHAETKSKKEKSPELPRVTATMCSWPEQLTSSKGGEINRLAL